ncbi:MAG: dipeptidase [Clostridia bacterium]|nr:dipeptidase [Clostridia bacterium]
MNNGLYSVADAHCDTIYEIVKQSKQLKKNDLKVSLEKLLTYEHYVQFFALWVDDAETAPFASVLQMLDIFYEELEKNKENLCHILKASDFKKTFDEKKVGALLTVENGKALMGSCDNLRLLYEKGVRGITLTWNGANELGDGALTENGGGLNDFGREVIYEMNRLGMLIDVSHLSEQGFWDVLHVSDFPIMASHSNAARLTPHPRNLKDEQLSALATCGGVVGLNLYPAFLSTNGKADLDDCVRHLKHMLSVCGENGIALGSDFDGFNGAMPEGLNDAGDYGKLFWTLKKAGWSETLIQKLTCDNLIRFASCIIK